MIKSSHEHNELLKEKLLEEKSRRERAESELSKLQEVQLTVKKLEDQLSSWKLMIKDIPGVSCFEDVPIKFAALQKYVNSYNSLSRYLTILYYILLLELLYTLSILLLCNILGYL